MRRPGGMEGEVVGPLLVVEALVGVDIEEGHQSDTEEEQAEDGLAQEVDEGVEGAHRSYRI